ncbi:MAG: hypothetical protein OM95_05185 [Bdellovibrio sp. ArHS]|uniref:hypothetical protein n=1 Tax=Bdellovibrio sp. ArHS TaxID=1569284 RepID=UPI000583A664|nr:hypothetical protein [Bdellovibrio sp. ArHS]KHD89209.1 MAG: hypothetical protein OM95_05185 [Bdellovibrio sp. ArHS]
MTDKAAKPKFPSHRMNYGKMNEHDARASGYTNKQGHAVDMAKPDVKGSPTGALTDIGAGRSSVVHPAKKS